MESIDVFCHWLPDPFCQYAEKHADRIPFMWNRARNMPVMVNIEARLRLFDQFPGYRQLPSLAFPPIELLTGPEKSLDLARVANDAAAEIVSHYPEAFPGFIAALPLNNPEGMLAETTRAITQLGAAGVQIFTSLGGGAIDKPLFMDLFALMTDLGYPIWLHPLRGMQRPDYADEEVSRFDLWWALGWPYETSLAMCRIVFAGVFDRWPDLKIIVHHAGGLIPMIEGRLGHGLDQLGTRNPPEFSHAIETPLKERPLQAIKRFYADTATFGSTPALECGRAFFGTEKLLFASDMPFDPEHGAGYIRETLRVIDELPISIEDKRKILSGNIRRILRLSGLKRVNQTGTSTS